MLKTPSKTPRGNQKVAFASPSSRVAMGTNSPSGPARFVDSTLNPIAYPMMAGYWDKVDFNNGMKSTGVVMIRMIVHPGITPQMVDAKWEDTTLLKIRFCWPEFFTSVLQMLAFDTDDNGAPKFGREHQLTGSFGKFVHERINEDGQVWDEGYLSFDRPMNQDSSKINVEVLDAKVGAKKFTLLQIVAEEDVHEEEKGNKATIGSRSVSTNSNTGKTYPNIRDRDERENEMDEEEETDVVEHSNKRNKSGGGVLNGFTHGISNALTNAFNTAPTQNDLPSFSTVNDQHHNDGGTLSSSDESL